MRLKIAVIGGDLRQLYAANRLMEQGYEVSLYGFSDADILGLLPCRELSRALEGAECVLLPMPVSRDRETLLTPLWDSRLSLSELFDKIENHQTVLCGMVGKLPLCYQDGIVDYAEDESFLLKNAYLTAEAAVEIAISKTPYSLRGASVLVTGYGRIGKFLARMLRSLGAVTYVTARRSYQLTELELEGNIPVSYENLFAVLPETDLIFNTVPHQIFDEKRVAGIKKDCLFVDLASLPGGICKEAADEQGLQVIHALSLPGKVAPVSSGKIVADTVIRLLSVKFRNKD